MGHNDDDIIELRETITSGTSREVSPGQKTKAWRPHYRPSTEKLRLLDKSINRKFDLFVVVILAVDFILQGLDKTNVHYAAENSSFVKHAHMTNSDITTSTFLFMASYVILQPFSTAVSRWMGCREWISVLLAVWGVLAMGHAAVRSRSAFWILRFALGAAEAGFIPVATYFLTTLYPKEYLAFRIGLFTGLFSLSAAFAGLLATAIMRLDPEGIHNWQVLYLLEGGVTVAMSFMSFWILPGSARTAWMLSPEEKAHAWHRMNEDSALPENHIEAKDLILRDVTDALKDWRKLVLVICTIFVIVPLWSFFSILPLIVHEFGYSGTSAGGMMMPPFIIGVTGLIGFSYASDRLRDRSGLLILAELIGIFGLVVMFETKSLQVRYAFTFISLAGAFTGAPLILCWLIDNSPLAGSRNIILGINGWANIAQLIANQFFQPHWAKDMFRYPLKIATILLTVSLCGVILIRISYMKLNSARKEQTADWTEQQVEEENCSTARRGNYRLTYLNGL